MYNVNALHTYAITYMCDDDAILMFLMEIEESESDDLPYV